MFAVAPVDEEAVGRYGIALGEPRGGDPFIAHEVVETPDPARVSSRMAIRGRYVLGPAVFAVLWLRAIMADGDR